MRWRDRWLCLFLHMQRYCFSVSRSYWTGSQGPKEAPTALPVGILAVMPRAARYHCSFAFFKFQPCHRVHWGPTSPLPLEITFQKTCTCTLSLPDKVKKHSYIDLHRKHILFHFKTLPGQCAFNSKPTAGNFRSSIGLLSACGSEIHLRGLRGSCKLWHPGFEIYKLWLPSPWGSRASSL